MSKLIVGVNDLATVNPDLAKEWHPTRNGDLTPSRVTKSSAKTVWWICVKGHEWQAPVYRRTSKNSGCPYCSGRLPIPGENDLATTHPELAAEWHPSKNKGLLPTEVMYGSGKKVWWRCVNGHEWQASPNSRNKAAEGRSYGCPYCSKRLVVPGKTDLATLNPELAAEWHPTKNGTLLPTQVTAGSNKKVWWLGKCGHEWQAHIVSRNFGTGCPVCAQESKTSFPEQAIFFYLNQLTKTENRYKLDGKTEIDIYLPEFKMGVEYDGDAWHKDVKRDLAKNEVCALSGIRLIRVREPKCPPYSAECLVLKSYTVDELNNTIAKLVSMLNKTIQVDVERDRSAIYAQYIQTIKQNSFLSKFPSLATEWHPTKNGKLQPSYIPYGSTKKVWWKCREGHEWQASPNRRSQNIGCPYCSGRLPIVGKTDLATTNPNLATEWHPTKNGGLKPSDVMKGTTKKVWWLGKCGHEWQDSPNHRSSGRGCPFCASKQIKVGNNDLASQNPSLAAEWHPTKNGDLLPTQVAPNSNKKVWWKCEKGHEWQAAVCNRSKGNNCPYCGNQKLLVGYNDFATTHPELAAEWHPTKNGELTPKDVITGSSKKVWWLCANSHEYQTQISNRIIQKRGCPYCSGRYAITGKTDLATINPDLAAEWHPTKNGDLKPSAVSAHSGKKVWWLGKCGHEWDAIVANRSRGSGCPICYRSLFKKTRKE